MKKYLLLITMLYSLNSQAQLSMVYDVYPGPSGGNPTNLTVCNGKLYFFAVTQGTGSELWSYSGTGVPTIVQDINPGAATGTDQAYNMSLGVLNNKLYFGGDVGGKGFEFMGFSGSGVPTLIADIIPGGPASSPRYFYTYNNLLFFRADNEVYTYDGISLPKLRDVSVNEAAAPVQFIEYNGKVYFNAFRGAEGSELFYYNDVTGLPVLAKDIEPGTYGVVPYGMETLNGKLYFSGKTLLYGRELYSYDGTNATRLTDLSIGPKSSVAGKTIAYNNKLYFSGSTTDGATTELYEYDPVTNKATVVPTATPAGDREISAFIVYNNKLYFNATSNAAGNELWVYDGTTAKMVADIFPGVDGSIPSDMVVFNNTLYFDALDANNGAELFSYKDSTAGIQNIWLDGTVVAAPNPTQSDVTLKLSFNRSYNCSIALADANGRLVWKQEAVSYDAGDHNISIPLSSMPAGMYFYHVADGSGKQLAVGKVIKQ